MKRLAALLLALMLLLGLGACGGPAAVPAVSPTPTAGPTKAPEERAVFALGYDPAASLHPITGDSQINLDLTGLVYQGLYELNNKFEPVPVLADSAEADESGLVWTITVKRDILFSDGTPLTADHVAASLRQARKGGTYAARLSEVASVKATEDAVVITLSVPNGALPALLDIPVVLEQEGGPPLGTGRYCFSLDGEPSLTVNGNYPLRESLPYGRIPLREVSTADRRIAAFDSGEVSLVTTDFSSPYALGYSGSYELFDYPTTNLIYVGFQTTKGACVDAEVRRACSLAFDRASVVQSLLGGHADPACLPVHPDHREYDDAAAALLDYDIQAAGELLAGLGYQINEEDGLRYKKRVPLTLTLIVNQDNLTRKNIAAHLADGLRSLGITVEVRYLSWSDYVKALESGDFDLYIGEIRLTGDFDITGLLTGGLNYGGYLSETLPVLLAERKATGNAAALWLAFTEEAPFAPLCFKRGSLLLRWGLASGLSPTRADPFRRMEQWNVIQ